MLNPMSNAPSDASGTEPENQPPESSGSSGTVGSSGSFGGAGNPNDPDKATVDGATDGTVTTAEATGTGDSTGARAAEGSPADVSALRKLGFDDPVGEVFADDQLRLRHAVIGVAAAALGAAALMFVVWFVLSSMSMPAFGGSMMTRALSTAGTVGMLVLVTVLMGWWAYRGAALSRPLRVLSYVVSYMSPAALVATTLALPLASTRLYLDGISVDQEFRTEYLSRLTSESGLHDMAYIDVASYYPAGWFWLGGRFADVLGMPGWEAFQPWSLITLAVAGSLLVPVWQRLCGSLPVATAIALVTTAIALSTTAEEPYAALVAMGLPAMIVMARRALSGARSAMIGVTVFLGVSATFYTLHTGVGALIVVVLALLMAVLIRSWVPLVRLAVIGVGSVVIAAIVWAPYVIARLTGAPASGATATHYLPGDGASVPLPMLAGSIIGFLCLIGVIWLVVRAADPDTRALGLGVLVMYAWTIASMIATLGGQTLLGFRLSVPITMALATAGVFGIADIRLNGVQRLWPQMVREDVAVKVSAALGALILIFGIAYAQAIPNRIHHAIDLAHTDTDGYGERGDHFAPDAGSYYGEIDQMLTDAGLVHDQNVVLTDERNFQAFFPWYSFQALTSHYANPLGEFDKRNQAIEEWTAISDPEELVDAMDSTPWQGPDALVLRGDLDNPTLSIDVADDIFPNNPNVLFRGVAFDTEVFDEEFWRAEQIGPFVVLIRR